jgi:WD40 repeat protein/tRNA A-37 threonylcarbamoyl transferase component Bud32
MDREEHTTTAGGREGAPGADPLPDLELPDADPRHYQVEGVFARGGSGLILKARDRRLRRAVAIKQILRSDVTGRVRFEREVLLTARLQHPAVVPIYEAGRWPNGEAFYAMRLVAGKPLSDVIAGCPALDERLALLPKVLAVTEAVAYAHRQRVLHRDLKPQNVMVGEFGEVVVLDWGLGKDLASPDPASPGSDDRAQPGDTVEGAVVGTPAYMPPEQARGEPVDERGDVYSLGALLYHVLAGAPPFAGASNTEILAAVLRGAPPSIEALQPGVPRDLAALVKKAMAREPSQRYASAGELCDELQRFVTGQLVQTHHYPRRVLWRRAIRRHPLAAATAGFAVVLALFGALAFRRVAAERTAAEALGHRLLVGQARALLDSDPTEAVALLKHYPRDGGDEDAVRAIALDAQSRGVARHVLSGHRKQILALAFSPDGAQLASGDLDGVLMLWSASTGEHRQLYSSNDGAISNVTFDRSSRYLAASLGAARALWLFDQKTQAGRVIPVESDAYTVEFSPDGAWLAAGDAGGEIWLWNVADGGRRNLSGHRAWVNEVTFSPDGSQLLSVSEDATARLWNLTSGEARVIAGETRVVAGAFSGDGAWVALGGEDGVVRLLSTTDGALPVRVLRSGHGAVARIASSHDGTWLAWAGAGREVHVARWRSDDVQVLHGHEDDVTALAFLPDDTLVTSSGDATVRRWDLASGFSDVLRGHADRIAVLAVTGDGRRLASAGSDTRIRVWDLAPSSPGYAMSWSKSSAIQAPGRNEVLYFPQRDGDTLRELDLRSGQIHTVTSPRPAARMAGDPTGRRVAFRDGQGRVSLLELSTGAERPLAPGVHLIGPVLKFSPDGATLAIPGRAGIDVVDVDSLATRELPYPSGPLHKGQALVEKAQFSSDGRRLITFGADIVVWDLSHDRSTIVPVPEPGAAKNVFGDGELAAIGITSASGLWLRDRAGGGWHLLWHRGHDIYPVVFSADGQRIAAATDDGQLRIWRVSDAALTLTLTGHDAAIRRLEFAPDGQTLLSAGLDGAVRLWDVATGQQLRTIRAHHGRAVEWAGFHGAEIVTAGNDGAVRIWPTAAVPARSRASLLEDLTTAVTDPEAPRLPGGDGGRVPATR